VNLGAKTVKSSWETPKHIVYAAERAMGGIDLDPCTAGDNPCGAANFCSPDGDHAELGRWIGPDGLAADWEPHPRVFLNPPWGKGLPILPWIEKVLDHVRWAGNQVIFICPAAMNARWMHAALGAVPAVFAFEGRVNYLDPVTRQAVKGCAFDTVALMFSVRRPWDFAREPGVKGRIL
jgi:phage N-6-adenine-methyltransferase